MDQSAFRQLLSAENDEKSSARIGRNLQQQQSERGFGKNQKRKSTANQFRSNDHHDNFIPRKLGKKKRSTEKNDQEGESEQDKLKKLYAENYTDRSAERRSGQESKSHEANNERRDPSRQAQTSNDEVQKVLLAGDAKHTVPVKGLDYALLEQQRAKMNGDDDLETAFQSSPSKKEPEKRVKASEDIVRHDKFKPIGRKSKEEERPEYIWRDGKRMRKKRKDGGTAKAKEENDRPVVTEKSNENRISSKQSSRQPNKPLEPNRTIDDAEHTDHAVQQSDKETEVGKVDQTFSAVDQKATKNEDESGSKDPPSLLTDENNAIHDDQKQITSDEEDEDIFEGAGRWEGFGNEGSDEEGAE